MYSTSVEKMLCYFLGSINIITFIIETNMENRAVFLTRVEVSFFHNHFLQYFSCLVWNKLLELTSLQDQVKSFYLLEKCIVYPTTTTIRSTVIYYCGHPFKYLLRPIISAIWKTKIVISDFNERMLNLILLSLKVLSWLIHSRGGQWLH